MTECPYVTDAGTCMSNIDLEVKEGAEEVLKNEEVYMGHAAWNFFGRVWWDRKRKIFREELWMYRIPTAKVEAPTLKELMEEANKIGGSG